MADLTTPVEGDDDDDENDKNEENEDEGLPLQFV